MHRLDADAKPLRHVLLAPIPSGPQPLIARREREAFESIHDRVRLKHATDRVDDPSFMEGSGHCTRGVVLAQVVDPGDESRVDHRRCVPRARQPDHAGKDGPGCQPHTQCHALAVSFSGDILHQEAGHAFLVGVRRRRRRPDTGKVRRQAVNLSLLMRIEYGTACGTPGPIVLFRLLEVGELVVPVVFSGLRYVPIGRLHGHQATFGHISFLLRPLP